MSRILSLALIGAMLSVYLEVYGIPTEPIPISQYFAELKTFDAGEPDLEHGPACTSQRMGKSGVIDERYRWTDFNVYIDPKTTQREKSRINQAMRNLQEVIPCIPFNVWPEGSNITGDYVNIVKGKRNGCNSYVGRLGWGKQDMNLEAPGCMNVGTITHEMMHALGFEHEHQRPDRDDYINIHWENVYNGWEFAFEKHSDDRVTQFGVPYNLKSVMHYPSWFLSKNRKPTMTTKNNETIKWYTDLHEYDKQKLRAMYPC